MVNQCHSFQGYAIVYYGVVNVYFQRYSFFYEGLSALLLAEHECPVFYVYANDALSVNSYTHHILKNQVNLNIADVLPLLQASYSPLRLR